MTAEIRPFAFGDNMVRVRMDDDGTPWFVAKDVALALGYQWNGLPRIAHVPEEWRGVTSVVTPFGTQEMLTLSEQGLYFFLGRSDKPGALPFQKWLAGEVLPSIRRTGSYAMPGAPLRGGDVPQEIPPAAVLLRPAMRQRLWQDALQTARLDGTGSGAALEWFDYLCRMAAVEQRKPVIPSANEATEKEILRFADICCVPSSGRMPANRLYTAFGRWWQKEHDEPAPSITVFGKVLPRRYRKIKVGGRIYYLDVQLT